MTSIDEQVAVLMSNTGYGDEGTRQMMTAELRERLIQAEKDGRPLRVYCGYDPRTSDLHLGHTITMRKLRQFQDFGHEVIFLIGSFTSTIGDPDDNRARDMLDLEQVLQNGQSYAEQAFKILDREKTRVLHNHEWLQKLSFGDVIRLAQIFTVQQFISRENFRNRIDDGTPIYLHEFFYPLMQGYDAAAMETDVQIGGQDQLFNLMAGRQLMSRLGQKPQIVIAMGESLPGTDGVLKMSKSKGNHIPIMTDALDMFGKIMSIPDDAMPLYFKLLLGRQPDAVDALMAEINAGTTHPRDAKAGLAREIVGIFHPENDPVAIQQEWERIFKQSGTPDDLPEYTLSTEQSIVDILADSGLVGSKGEAKRQIKQGGVRLEGEKIASQDATVAPGQTPAVLQVGKRKFVKLVAG
ncbi:MAG: tyrosine--tRNA ligase [Anaerolineales bacterium]